MYKKYLVITICITMMLALASCSSEKIVYYYVPPDLQDQEKYLNTIEDFKPHFTGKKLFIDPGHGGEDRRNTNKAGNVIEADVNLRVALFLKNFIELSNGEVILSRDTDKTVPLAFRSELANNSKADLFISIHHNAPARWEDDYTNYTSTYYHALEENYEYEPMERDLARFIQRDLSYVMRNPGGLGSFDGTYSDYFIYPGDGFSVLRRTLIPSVLVECAFHTSSHEEQRLNIEEFNKIQAWGIYRGLGKYLKADKPVVTYKDYGYSVDSLIINMNFKIETKTPINKRKIDVFINKQSNNYNFDESTGMLAVPISLNSDQTFLVRIITANKNGVHNLPFEKSFSFRNGEIIYN
ncbi:MAG: N-acetylmuramoyl-L-alanine amidase [Melioribacteraceae bacterium]|nr:N-acetylmuramoyl-L-alanine amidase [Melioribacteraceae bacterium]